MTMTKQRGPLAWLKGLYEYLAYYLGLSSFALMCLFWSIAAWPLLLLPKRLGVKLGRRIIMRGFAVYLWLLELSGIFKFDLQALDVLRHDRSLIIAPNHPSLIDVVMIVSRLPNVVCIIKAALSEMLIYGGSARLAGYIRGVSQTGLITDAVQEIQSGSQLLVFPEGTRTQGEILHPFKGGFALIAKKSNAPVQTVFIDINHPFLCKERPLWVKPEFPLHFSIRLGRRFMPDGEIKYCVAEMEDYCRSQVENGKPEEAR
ncbi:MAG: 1-acyl-sn-glycerol-3-phosphate acyltransferase [Azonexus sp.]|jgi:1-acyl-sn-glycerol-3-phosphate acyltransferase|nr:1-acyl-sn-glycerol-3-phosphate acyltransferase [Azonexus sp.]